jgi:hypothetical protein
MLPRLWYAAIAGLLLASFAPAHASDWPMDRIKGNALRYPLAENGKKGGDATVAAVGDYLLFMPPQPQAGVTANSAEAVAVPPMEEPGAESPETAAVDRDTRLAVNIAAGLAVGLLVIVACGIFYVARRRV